MPLHDASHGLRVEITAFSLYADCRQIAANCASLTEAAMSYSALFTFGQFGSAFMLPSQRAMFAYPEKLQRRISPIVT